MAQAFDRTGFLFTGWESVSPNGVVTRDAYSVRCEGLGFRRLDLDSFVSAWLDLDACPVFPSGVVIRRDLLLDAGLFQERCRRGEDKDMWLRVLAITDALSSPRVCSSYYRDIPGAMNETISTNVRHCLCATLEEMISQASGARRHLLMRLFNHQVIDSMWWESILRASLSIPLFLVRCGWEKHPVLANRSLNMSPTESERLRTGH